MKNVVRMTDSQKLDFILTEISGMESKLEKLDSMESDIKNIKLTLENEIRVNIQRIAEGHLDLSRNLHEAMKPSKEMEMQIIKVNALESEVRELKRKIS